MIDGWRYYNHAMIPTCAPHENANIKPLDDKSIWKSGGSRALLARWTTDWDCGYETNWWYVIKDTPFDLKTIQSKKRYEINKGNNNFDVKIIHAEDYAEVLYDITKKAYEQYPEKYRPPLEHDSFVNGISSWNNHEVYGAFYRESNELCGYAWINVYDSYVDFCVLKANPEYERYAINAAIVYAIVSNYSNRLNKNFYICDGAKATVHETHFQDYLEKYFEFRKAYCKLNVAYPFPVNLFVKILYPFRNLIKGKGNLSSKIFTVLQYENFSRE